MYINTQKMKNVTKFTFASKVTYSPGITAHSKIYFVLKMYDNLREHSDDLHEVYYMCKL